MKLRWPNYILPFIALLLWIVSAIGYHAENKRLKSDQIASLIHKELVQSAGKIQAIGQHQLEVLQWLHHDPASGSQNWVYRQSCLFYAYSGDSLIAWSSNQVLPASPGNHSARIAHLKNGIYYEELYNATWLPKGISLLLLHPISINYSLSNDYLKPRFLASNAIPSGTLINDTAGEGTTVLRAASGQIIGNVHASGEIPVNHSASLWQYWFWIISIFLIFTWVQRLASHLAKEGSKWQGLSLVVLAIIIIRGLLYLRGLPFQLNETALFSPTLYASNELLPSLGDLLLNALAALWLVSCLVRFFPWHHWIRKNPLPKFAQWLILLISTGLLAALVLLYTILVRSLVLNSQIPFDTSHLSSLDTNTLSGLLIATILTTVVLAAVVLIRRVSGTMQLQNWQRISAILIAFGISFIVKIDLEYFGEYLFAGCWVLFFLLMKGFIKQGKLTGVFRPTNLLWSAGHCLLLTFLIHHYTEIRELTNRKNFAEHIASRHDDALEYNFSQIEPHVQDDPGILNFLKRPSASGRKALNERLARLYFNNSFSAYQTHLYIFDNQAKPLFNTDSLSLPEFVTVSQEEMPSSTASDLYYREAATNDHIYLGIVPLSDTDDHPLGKLIIDLEQKKIVAETVLPELLKPATVNNTAKNADYSYALYVDHKLVAQTSNYPFPFYIPHDTTHQEFYERKGNDFSTLIYTPDSHRTAYVWHQLGTIPQLLTLFSYLLLLRFLFLGIIRLYRSLSEWLHHPGLRHLLNGASLRYRVQLSVMAIVLISFLLIGAITVIFLRYQYVKANEDQRQAMMQSVSRSIQQYMKDADGATDTSAWRMMVAQPGFKFFLGNLASGQKIDINLFDADGKLAIATQQPIYDQGLLAPVIAPDVLENMGGIHSKPLLMREEQIGKLKYISCYTALRTENGGVAGYLNVPLFSSQKELDQQISGVVVALINLYAIIFLLSSILAVVITRWITRAFDVIIRQFGRLSLHGNEPLQWPYNDEIGILVGEYNKMVKKVEENVALLAKSEREGAWKEMARQVAHEIKNPLTPMSLNVQYLQRAIQSRQGNIEELALRTSESLLEQINNLSVIASEFADFARIGSKPEQVDLNDILSKVVDLYYSKEGMEVRYETPGHEVWVLADRSQMVRIITNLMQNAVQSIPEDRHGMIRVCLKSEGTFALIEVQDNGSGITGEAQEKLFTPYFTTKSSGTGLGLAMTRQMVEVWGGEITYQTSPGEGTSFHIRLPLSH